MKVRILNVRYGSIIINDIVEALENPTGNGEIVTYDKRGDALFFGAGDWEKIEEPETVHEETTKKETLSERVVSLRDMFGQDMQSITFK